MKSLPSPFAKIRAFSLCLAVAGLSPLGSQSALAATTYTWNSTTSGALWSAPGSWVGNAVPTFVAGDTFDLSTLNIGAATTSTMDTVGGNTLGTVKIGDTNNTHSWTLSLSTALTLDGNGSAATINQISTSKGDTINGAGGIVLASDLNSANASGNTLTISNAITATGATRTITNNGGGNGQVNFGGAIGAGINLVQNSTTSGTFLGATSASFNGTMTVKAGFLSLGTTGGAIGLGTASITLGDTSGSSNATLFLNSINGQGYSSPITVASGSSGIKSIVGALNSGNNTAFITSTIALGVDSSHTADLTVGNSTNNTSTWQLRGAITGFGNLTVKTTNTGRTQFTSASSINNTGTLTNAGTSSGAAQIDAVVGTNVTGVVQNSSTSQMNLNAANTYTGATTVTAGTLSVGSLANGGSNSNIGASTNAAGNLILNGGTFQYTGAAVSTDRLFSLQSSSTINASGSGAVNFTNTGSMGFNSGTAAKTLTLTGTNTGANTIAAVIGDNTGATSVTKSGAGTWVLSGANTYTGATTVSDGTLIVSGSLSGTTGVTVSAPATLASGITGSITTATAGSVSVSGSLAPGNVGTVGTLTLAPGSSGGKLSFVSGSTFKFDIDGTTSDLVAFSTPGDWLTGNNNVTLALNGIGSGINYGRTYTVFQNANVDGFTVAGITGYDTAHYSAQFAFDGSNNYQVSFLAVPEPGSAVSLLGSLGLLVGTLRVRRRKRVNA